MSKRRIQNKQKMRVALHFTLNSKICPKLDWKSMLRMELKILKNENRSMSNEKIRYQWSAISQNISYIFFFFWLYKSYHLPTSLLFNQASIRAAIIWINSLAKIEIILISISPACLRPCISPQTLLLPKLFKYYEMEETMNDLIWFWVNKRR